MNPDVVSSERGPSCGDLLKSLYDSELRAKLSRLHNEMFENLAPPVVGAAVNAGRRHRGRLVFGDAVD